MVNTAVSQVNNRQFYALLAGSTLGFLFEWYDTFLAATAAAVVWPRIFFPARFDPVTALAVSVASVGIAYLVRPVGAILFGHLGDRYGRRTTMIWTLILMGISSIGTALLPPYAAIGMLAIVMIFVFRVIIGIGLGGEAGGAYSWIMEARPNSKHRAFWMSWPTAVLDLGKLLSIFAFFLASSLLAPAAYYDWGWRVPFLVGGVMVVIAIIIRTKMLESPMFNELQVKKSILKYPAFEVIRKEWRKIFKLMWLDTYNSVIPALVILPYSVSYLVKLGVGESFATLSVTGGTFAAFCAVFLGGYLSDCLGRLRVLRVGAVMMIVWLFPYFFLLNTLNWFWIIIAQLVIYALDHFVGAGNRTLYTESFATKYRYSGSGLTQQLAGFVSGLMVALILPALLLTYGILGASQPIIWISIALAIVSIIASFFVKETRDITLE